MSQKAVTEDDIKQYQLSHDVILRKLVSVKRASETEKQELVLRLIEVSEPLSHGKLCSDPQELCITLWKELEVNGLSGWISYGWFSEQFPSYLKRKYSKSQVPDNFLTLGTINDLQLQKSLDGKRFKYGDLTLVVEDTKQKEEKIEKETARDLLKAELKTSIVIDCIRTSSEFLDQVKSFLSRMEEKFRENPKILDDFEKTLEWKELHGMCTSLKTLYTGEGSIIRQMHQETNFRAPATVLQLALAKTLGSLDTYRNWAHKLTVSPRQYQRIRERLGDWPLKKAIDIIRKSLGSVMCPNCQYNLVTQTEHPKVAITDTREGDELDIRVYLGETEHTIPKEFKKHGTNPIQVCEQMFLGNLNKK